MAKEKTTSFCGGRKLPTFADLVKESDAKKPTRKKPAKPKK